MKVLIVDSSRRGRQIYRRFLSTDTEDFEICEYDPVENGVPGPDFDWSQYEVMLLSQDLGAAGSAIDWLTEFGTAEQFPATVVLLAKADQQASAQATQAGACEVLVKRELDAGMLQGSMKKALQVLAERTQAGEAHASNDAAVVREIGERDGLEGGYSFQRLIGQGAMSRVYLAERIADKQSVVLKILDGTLADEEEAVKRFILEAKLVGQIDSPHVVSIFEQGFTNAYGYMAMEFFSRGDLKQKIEQGVHYKLALQYLLQMAKGLKAVHDAGIVHRDLKPANIMFRANGELVIADFGIAKRTDTEAQLTALGAIMGTPFYMSPEQVRGNEATYQSDLYSAGVIFYEMLTGEKPFTGETLTAIVLSHLDKRPPPLPEKLAPLQAVVDRLIAREVEDRCQNADELIESLKRFARK